MAETIVKSVRADPDFWARVEAYAERQCVKVNPGLVNLVELGLAAREPQTFSPAVEDWISALTSAGMTRHEALSVALEEVLARPRGQVLERAGDVEVVVTPAKRRRA